MLNDKVLNLEQYKNLVQTIGEDIVRANYDQEPIDLKGVLYEHLVTYTQKPNFVRIEAVCDTADTGSDYLCSIVYGKTDDRMAYILDVIYTKESMETTENKVAKQFTDYNVSIAHIESNNGGRGFARSVERICRTELNNRITVFKPYTQTLNKQSRILSNATAVELNVRFPQDWKQLYPEFYKSVTEYQREGKNAHDDAEDALTSIVEKTVLRGGLKFS
jgi:predicted phage terminase large subunit-like protein